MQRDARVLSEEHGRLAVVTISNPRKRNALDPLLLGELASELDRLQAVARVVILRGEGERLFSSGYDIGAIRGGAGEETSRHPLAKALGAIESFPFPVIAMIFGGAYGAACELAAACDLRFAASNAHFAIPAARLGIVYPPEGVQRLARNASPALVRELLFTARTIDAERAQSLGLLQGMHAPDGLEVAVRTLAGEIADLAPRTLTSTKRMLATLAERDQFTPDEIAEYTAIRDQALSSADFKEGQAAFAAKRSPRFTGA
jgi:methylmalonyl-CoA decarboxylase